MELTPADFIAEVRAHLSHPKLEILSDRIDGGVPIVTVRNHSFGVTFEVSPAEDFPARYHARTKSIGV